MSKDTWVSFGGRKQRASELSPELRKRLGIKTEEEKGNEEESQKIKVSRVRNYDVYERPEKVKITKIVERKECHKTPDSGMDVIARFVGRYLGRKWARLKQ